MPTIRIRNESVQPKAQMCKVHRVPHDKRLSQKKNISEGNPQCINCHRPHPANYSGCQTLYKNTNRNVKIPLEP